MTTCPIYEKTLIKSWMRIIIFGYVLIFFFKG
jgi:hypothetical protein